MDKYVEVHRKLVDKLRVVGVHYSYDSRLALFWLRNNIKYVVNTQEGVGEIVNLIDDLVRLRAEGLEPYNNNGVYIERQKDTSSGNTGSS